MVEILGLLGYGFSVGCFGTLVGIGGGPLLIPMLAIFYHLPPSSTVATSLSVVFLNALSGSLAYHQEKRIDLVSAFLFGMYTIPGSIAAYFLLTQVSHSLFDKVFGVFLVLLALYVFFGSPPSPHQPTDGHAQRRSLGPLSPRRIVDSDGRSYCYEVDERLGNLINVIFGAGTTILGIGGGILQVPLLVYVLRFPVHVATATSHCITAINTFITLIPLLYFGHVDPKLTLCLGLGAVAGARLGARLSRRFSDRTLLLLLGIIFLFAALRMLGSH